MRNPIDIVAELVSHIDNEIKAIDVFENFDGTWTVTTCDPSYANTITKLNGVEIISIVGNGSAWFIWVRTQVTTPLFLDAPQYYHGTAIEVNKKINSIETSTLLTLAYPMIYFPEVRNQTEYPENEPVEMEADCRLIFAVNFRQEWTAEDIKNYCINPMLNLVSRFRDVVRDDLNISITGYRVEQYSKLGDKVEGKGTIYNAINDNCSGVVVDFTMSVNHDFICTCCCP